MRRVIGRLSVATLVAVIGVWAIARHGAGSPGEARGDRDDGSAGSRHSLAALEHELASLRASASAMSSRLRELELSARDPSRAGARAADAPPDDEPHGSSLSRAEREDAFAAHITAEFDRHVSIEPVDPAWTEETRQQLRDLIAADKLPDMDVGDVTCGSTICRIELRNEGKSARINISRALGMPPFHGQTVSLAERDMSGLTAYVSRPGEMLPPIEPPAL